MTRRVTLAIALLVASEAAVAQQNVAPPPGFVLNNPGSIVWDDMTTSTGSVWVALSETLERDPPGGADAYRAWFEGDHSSDRTAFDRSARRFVAARCGSNEIANIAGVSYAPDGTLTDSFNRRYRSFRHVVPGTLGSWMHRWICTTARQSP